MDSTGVASCARPCLWRQAPARPNPTAPYPRWGALCPRPGSERSSVRTPRVASRSQTQPFPHGSSRFSGLCLGSSRFAVPICAVLSVLPRNRRSGITLEPASLIAPSAAAQTHLDRRPGAPPLALGELNSPNLSIRRLGPTSLPSCRTLPWNRRSGPYPGTGGSTRPSALLRNRRSGITLNRRGRTLPRAPP